MMKHSHAGSCLCGEVKFKVDGEFNQFYLCHCKHCQKDTGSAHAANLFSGTAQLTWVTGEASVRTFNLPSTRHTKAFCLKCGSALPSLQMEGQLLVVPAGSLDSDLSMAPTAHIFYSSKAHWESALEKIKTFERLPQ